METPTSLQVYPSVKAALNILAQEEQLRTKKRTTPNDVIWKLIESQRPDVIRQVEAAREKAG